MFTQFVRSVADIFRCYDEYRKIYDSRGLCVGSLPYSNSAMKDKLTQTVSSVPIVSHEQGAASYVAAAFDPALEGMCLRNP
jgi:hypothetical protein